MGRTVSVSGVLLLSGVLFVKTSQKKKKEKEKNKYIQITSFTFKGQLPRPEQTGVSDRR